MIETIVCVALAKELIYSKIVSVAQEYDVSESVMDYVVRNESGYNNCAVGDTHLVDPDGDPHVSLGAVQINRYYNPDISEAEATDIDFSLRFLAQKLKEGRGNLWTTYRNLQKHIASSRP